MSNNNGVLITLIVIALVAILVVGGFLVASQMDSARDYKSSKYDNQQNNDNVELALIAKKVSDLQAENKRLENEIDSRKSPRYEYEYDGDLYYGSDFKCRDLEDDEDDIEDEIDDKEDDIDDLEDEIEELEQELQQAIDDNEDDDVIEDLEDKIEDLKDELDDEEDELDDLEDEEDDIDDDQELYKCYKNYIYDYYYN